MKERQEIQLDMFHKSTNKNRLEAQFAGRKVYHGKPCRNCGLTGKYVENYLCVECARRRAREAARRKKRESSCTN